jgi:hypothetical protein
MTLPMGRALGEVFGQTVSDLANNDPRIVNASRSAKVPLSALSSIRAERRSEPHR